MGWFNLLTLKQKFSIFFFCIAKFCGIICVFGIWFKSVVHYIPFLVLAWIIFLLISVCIALTDKPEEIKYWWLYYDYKEKK